MYVYVFLDTYLISGRRLWIKSIILMLGFQETVISVQSHTTNVWIIIVVQGNTFDVCWKRQEHSKDFVLTENLYIIWIG